ncbi:MAG: hypothetical protein JST08_10715 [Actinobacteria bacterium]|nr:hypothetical protein [Actinomycetota bacterium]
MTAQLIRPKRPLLVALGALLVLVLAPAAAHALPQDPPIAPLGPADGSNLSFNEDGVVHVTFNCPDYHSEEPLETREEAEEREEKEKEEGKKPKPLVEDMAGSDAYIVRFSPTKATDAEGLLTTAGFGEFNGEGFADLEKNKAGCGADFEVPDNLGPAALYQGIVYWQVGREVVRDDLDKEINLDDGKIEYEVGPIWAFNLQPKVEEPLLETKEHIYAGYLTPIEFTAGSDLTGATVELQHFVKGDWESLGQEPIGFSNTFFVKMAAAHTALRAVLKTPRITLPLEPRKVTVRKVGKRRAGLAKDDGRYKTAPHDESIPGLGQKAVPLSFKVVGGGKKIVGLRTSIEVTCPGPTSAGSKVWVKTALRSARIAPDGTVVGQMLAKNSPEPQYVTFVGQFFDQQLSGTLTTAFGPCSGSRDIEAIPVSTPPKKSAQKSAK